MAEGDPVPGTTVDIPALAKELGIPIDEAKPLESVKAVFDGLKNKAKLSEDLTKQLTAIEGLLQGMAGVAGGEGGAQPGDKGTDPDTGRKAQMDMMDAQILPIGADLQSILESPAETRLEKSLQEFNDTGFYLSKVMRKPVSELVYWKRTLERSVGLQKALTTSGVGTGKEWIPTGFSDLLYEELQLELLLAANLVQQPMPTNPWVMPYKTGHAIAYMPDEVTDITKSQFTTGGTTMTAKTFACALQFSKQMQEDSIIAVMPVVRKDIAETLGTALESSLINGDDAVTHQDSDVTAADDPRKAFDGFRLLSLAASALKVDGASFNVTAVRNLRKAMQKYATNPRRCFWLVGVSTFNAMLSLVDGSGNPIVMTVDKYGPSATLLTGELARLDGMPVVVTGLIREDLNASGVYDGVTVTKTACHLVNGSTQMVGTRRDLTIEDDQFILSQSVIAVATARWAFMPRIAISNTHRTAGIIYNITS